MNTQKKVLIVDDDMDFLIQLETQLRAAGFAVISADSRHKAEELLQSVRPDLVVLDLMMEQNDAGFALAYHIKKIDSAIPVILVTAVASETRIDFDAATDEERSWIKADAFLAKPIRFEQLMREINRLIPE